MRKIGMLVSLAAAFGMVFAVSITLTKEGTHLLPEGVTSFVKIGNYIYTAAGNWGVVIYDVSDSSNIVQAGVWRADENDFTTQTVTEVLDGGDNKLVVLHQGPGFEISLLDISSPTTPSVISHVTDRMLFGSFGNRVVRCADIFYNIVAIGIEKAGIGQGGVMLVNIIHPDSLFLGSVWWGESDYNIEDIIAYSNYLVITQWNSDSSRGRIVSLEYDDVSGYYIAQKDTYSLGGYHPYGIAKGVYREEMLYFYVALGSNGVGTYKLLPDGTILSVGTWTKTDTTDDVRDLFVYGDRLFICNFESDTSNITGIIVAPIDTTTWMPTDTVAVYPARYVRAAWADTNRVYFVGDISKGSGTAPGAR